MKRTKQIGASVPRAESFEKVTGRAVYAADVTLPNMLWGKVLRSPVAYGRIKRIDIAKALAVPGVKAVVTGADVTGVRIRRQLLRYADSRRRHRALYRRESRSGRGRTRPEIAEAGLARIEVEFEEFAAVARSRRSDGSRRHVTPPASHGIPRAARPLPAPSNAFVQLSWKKGAIEEGFRRADRIVENTFSHPRVCTRLTSSRTPVWSTAHPSGGAEIWACSKVPFALRDQLATAFGIAVEKFLVHPCYIGGDFGGKGDFHGCPGGVSAFAVRAGLR